VALHNRLTITDGNRDRIKKNIGLLSGFFQHHNDVFSWHPPHGGSLCFPRLTSEKNSFDFCHNLIANTGIMLLPSRIFDYGDHHVRVGLGRENLGEILDVLDDYLPIH
jgi:aspartate/methionine/tyrosine aminotransferase